VNCIFPYFPFDAQWIGCLAIYVLPCFLQVLIITTFYIPSSVLFIFLTPEFIQFVTLNQLKDNTVSHDMCFLMAKLEYTVRVHLKESRSHHKIISTRRVTCSEFHTEDHIQNVVAWATWHAGFVYPCFQAFALGCMYISYSLRVCCVHMTCCASACSKRILIECNLS